MQITIGPSKLSGLNAIVSRLNSVEGAEQTTAEAYLTERIHEILSSYDASEVARVMQENAAFFQQAALLPASVQQQLRDLIASASASS
jgi:hypothetical protein